MRPAVFLDRDGTMIRDVGYLSRREDLEWFPWTLDAIRLLNRAGYAVVVVTNQGGIGLGLYQEDFVRGIHEEMAAAVADSGGRVDGWYYCPHHPQATIAPLRMTCDCRKPEPAMCLRAERDLGLDLRASFVVGDKISDLGLAARIGARGALVRTGHGEAELARSRGAVPAGARVLPDLMAAAAWILGSRAGDVPA
jgi:D-glycero-D-manno-heptose 1,7-bisphosphate phosphatase